MSQPTFTMPPVQPMGNQPLPRAMDDPVSAPAQPMQPAQPIQPMHEVPVQKLAPEEVHNTRRSKGMLANPDSLYKFISWEDPARTMSSYAAVMAALFAVHYLPLTRTGLKVGATAFGAVAAAEYGHRVFTPNTIMSRMRPRQYRRIPEPVLNDTLKDVHDLLQFLVVEAQRIVYAEKLDRTIAAFVGFTTLYWLVKFLSPFALTLFAVTMVYAAPLAMSPRGREAMENAKVQAVQLGNTALETSQNLAADGRVKAAEMSSKAQETAAGLTQTASQTASNVTAQVSDKAAGLSQTASQTASNMTTDNTKDLHDLAANTLGNNKIIDTSKLSADKTTTMPKTSIDSVGTTASSTEFNNTDYSLGQTSKGLENTEKSIPRNFDDMGLSSAQKAAPGLSSTTATDQAGDSGIMGRPRGVPLADIDGAPVFGKFHEGAM